LACLLAIAAELVDVPATLGLENGVWFQVRQGVRAVLVRDEAKVARAYPICEPASYYYRVMTRSHWMPVLIGERFCEPGVSSSRLVGPLTARRRAW
jgi:hypothetical protein